MQSRKMSMVETAVSTVIGYSVATISNFYILPLFGYKVTLAHASSIGVIFTLISLLRGYAVRRLFNWYSHTQLKNIVELPEEERQAAMNKWMQEWIYRGK